jgi:pilus assembly protein Flp/PilA
MKNLKQIANFVNDESGQDLIEYALVAAVVALGAVTALTSVSTAISSAFTRIGTAITTGA